MIQPRILRRILLLLEVEAAAVAGRAEEGAPFDDVLTVGGAGGRPFPDVAGDVVKTVGGGGKAFDGSYAGEAVKDGVFVGEGALPPVAGEGFLVGDQLFAPGIVLAAATLAGGVDPFLAGREAFAGPGSVGFDVAEAELDGGVVGSGGSGIGAEGVAEGSSLDGEPAEGILTENAGPTEVFRLGDVAGGGDEGGEGGSGDLCLVEEEAGLLRPVTGDPHHPGGYFVGHHLLIPATGPGTCAHAEY